MTPLQRQLREGERRPLAKALGCSLRYLHGVCQGRLKPSWDFAFNLSAALGGRLSAEEIRGELVPDGARVRSSEPVDPSKLDSCAPAEAENKAPTAAAAPYSFSSPADLTPPTSRHLKRREIRR